MILRIFLAVFLFGISNANADVRRIAETMASTDTLGAIVTTISVPTTGTVFTRSFDISQHQIGEPVGVMFKAASTGVINLTIIPQQSYQRPTTEGSSDATYVNWGITGATTTSDTAWRVATLDSVLMPYGRFKIIGNGSNDAATTIQIKVAK